MTSNPDKWSHQPEMAEAIQSVRRTGVKRILAVCPTGGGKTRVLSMLTDHELNASGRVVVYSNRRVIHDQIIQHFDQRGLGHLVGVRAAGMKHQLNRPIQISSIQTDYARCIKRNRWELHKATLVLQDEAHSNGGPMAKAIHDEHHAAGATIVGFTATPIGVSHMYDFLVIGPTKKRLRAAGVLVKCLVWAPTEIDLRGLKLVAGEYSMKDFSPRLTQPAVFGDVLDAYQKINPEQRPTILFAPGVSESLWFKDLFEKNGIPAEHLDADTKRDVRERIFQSVWDGQTKILTSCGVLREGFDLPIISHAILCQPTKKLKTYLQMIGRVLRAAPGKEYATLADHVGAWHRLGSPNDDYDWDLKLDEDEFRDHRKRKTPDGKDRVPVCCPECGQIRIPSPPNWEVCPCGHKGRRSVRKVRTAKGELVLMRSNPAAEKKPKKAASDVRKVMVSAIFAGIYRNMTAGQVVSQARLKLDGKFFTTEEAGVHVPSALGYQWNLRAKDIPEWEHFVRSVVRQQKKRKAYRR